MTQNPRAGASATPYPRPQSRSDTSVDPSYRRLGLAVAVKAASIKALAADGIRNFGTGGAQSNAGSIRMNEHLGYVIEERWLSLAPPQQYEE